jgi:hypothetical protein
VRELKIYCFHVEATEKEHIQINKRMKKVLSELQKENEKSLIEISLVVKSFVKQSFANDYRTGFLKQSTDNDQKTVGVKVK